MLKKAYLIFGALTAALILAYIIPQQFWKDHFPFRPDQEKIHDFFEAFGAIATAGAFTIAAIQFALDRKERFNRDNPTMHLIIPTQKVWMTPGNAIQGLPRQWNAVYREYDETEPTRWINAHFYLKNIGLGPARSLRVQFEDYDSLLHKLLEKNEQQKRSFGLKFSTDKIIPMILKADPKGLVESKFLMKIKVEATRLDGVVVVQNFDVECKYGNSQEVNQGWLHFDISYPTQSLLPIVT